MIYCKGDVERLVTYSTVERKIRQTFSNGVVVAKSNTQSDLAVNRQNNSKEMNIFKKSEPKNLSTTFYRYLKFLSEGMTGKTDVKIRRQQCLYFN